MTSRHFLAIVALSQGTLLVSLVILIVLNRWFRLRRRAREHPRRVALDAVMQRWALGEAEVGMVLLRLARLPVPLAVDALVTWSARVPGDRWRRLATELEHQWWTRLVRANSDSARWWKRLETARFLTAALERLPTLVPTVGAYYAGMLRRSRPLVVQHLDKMLRRTDDPALPRLTEFAARLQEPALRERLTALAEHPDPEVRTQAVRALGGYPHSASVAALTRAATDAAWPVRAHAVRSLGMLADSATLPEVRAALRDGEWWVRLRAALALTRFGPGGRNALLEAEVGADPSARDMARLVLGLPAQALAEFAA